jgi:hypothetical protein
MRAKGEGSIYQRKDGIWSAQITLPDGKRKTHCTRTKKELDALFKQMWRIAIKN